MSPAGYKRIGANWAAVIERINPARVPTPEMPLR